MGSDCVKKILGLNEHTGKATEIAKKNNIRLFEKGVYIDITDLSQYVLDVLRDYMQQSSIQYIKRWMDMYKTNPIMLAVIQSVYEEKQQQILAQKAAQQRQVAKPRQLPRGPPAMTFLTAEMRDKYGSYDKYLETQREVY
jgi:menaquinone-dependent protoporphyrinogen IX oxidase